MYKHLLLLFVVFVAACSSSTQQTTSAPSAAAETASSAETVAAASDDGEDIICKRVQITGTRFKEKVCTTRAQREAAQAGAGSAVSDWQRRSAQAGGPLEGGL